jgi:hypothetical protein
MDRSVPDRIFRAENDLKTMTEKQKAETMIADPAQALRLWFGLLGPPTVWAIQFEAVYLGSEWACYSMDYRWIHVASTAALLISLFAFWIAFSEWRAVGGGTEDEITDQDSRRRFMAILGMLTGILFTALVFATWLPTLTGVPCGK